MAEFPNGYLLMHEFSTLAEAHSTASRLASNPTAGPDFRLIEVSPTAAGAWVCAFDTKPWSDIESVEVNEVIMNAFLSLGPKPDSQSQSIGIVEHASIAQVFQATRLYLERGLQLLEIRIKRAGPSGAYAFFAIPSAMTADGATIPTLPMSIVPLSGDYRRFF